MPDWPAPVEIFNAGGASAFLLLCEHAANHIPAEYDGLGLSKYDLSRHIAWDIGAAEVARRLSALIDAPAYVASYSRLLIDLNRPLAAASSIVTRSEDTDIPGNAHLDDAERARRAVRIFRPFHDAVTAHLDRCKTEGRTVRLVAVHSFTPVYRGIARPWHAGVLFDRAEAFGRAVIAGLRAPGVIVDANVPYVSSRDEDYAVPVHGDDRGIPAILVEIRQDLIADSAGQAEWADRLAAALISAG